MEFIKKGVLNLYREKEGSFQIGYSFGRGDVTGLLELKEVLSDFEKKEFSYLKYPKRRLSYLLGRICSKISIKQLIGEVNLQDISIVNGVFGFPVVKGGVQNIMVTYSHCNNIGISLAFREEFLLGIDIEKISKEKSKLVQKYITKDEQTIINDFGLNVEGCFFLWTIKEALSKIIKTGFTLSFDILAISNFKKVCKNIWESQFVNFSQYKGISLMFDDHVCSIVLPKNTYLNYNDLKKMISDNK